MLGTPGAPGLPVQCTHTHTAPHTDAHTKHANTQNIQSHKPIHAHNYKSLYVHTNACVRTHGHPSKYAHTCSYTKPHIHVITPTKHTGAHSYTQKCTNVCHLRMHTKRTHSPSLSLPLSVPQAGQEPRSPIWRLGREHLRQESAHECLCVADWVCLLCVSVCKAGASGLHWLAVCRSQSGSPPHCSPPPSVVPHLPVRTPGMQPRPWEPVYGCQGASRQRGPAGTSACQCPGPQFLRL